MNASTRFVKYNHSLHCTKKFVEKKKVGEVLEKVSKLLVSTFKMAIPILQPTIYLIVRQVLDKLAQAVPDFLAFRIGKQRTYGTVRIEIDKVEKFVMHKMHDAERVCCRAGK